MVDKSSANRIASGYLSHQSKLTNNGGIMYDTFAFGFAVGMSVPVLYFTAMGMRAIYRKPTRARYGPSILGTCYADWELKQRLLADTDLKAKLTERETK